MPSGVGDQAQSTLAFFPGYPLLIQAGSSLTGLSPRLVGLCLLALVRARWLVAGLAAALAGLVRPTGLVLTLLAPASLFWTTGLVAWLAP